ncbi:MAG: exodeoxyribonuclease VII large subunit [Pseudomonadota bacterium]
MTRWLVILSALMESIDISQSEEIFTVSRLNREARFILEGSFPLLWVEGEISNLAIPSSGHWYFSLKDAASQVRCAMFKPNNRRMGFVPKDGMHVMMKAQVSLYEGRGEFQLIGEHLEEVGEGQLRKAFDELKKRLLAAGLFDSKHKKTLPVFPTAIGVITSPTGAAIRDILSVLGRRFANVPIIIYPTLVQGDAAAANIVNAIHLANERQECDVLILARGGGSLEDLWPFNEEIVARAIYNSAIPLISGVGHEVDFTIADFVADVRAPTPSAAAELIAPDGGELLKSLNFARQRLVRLVQQQFLQLQQQLDWINKHLHQQHPKRRLQEQTEQIQTAIITLIRLQTQLIVHRKALLQTLMARLASLTPKHKVRELSQYLLFQQQQLTTSLTSSLQLLREQLGSAAATLDALSPLATLHRGYAVATKKQHVLSSFKDVKSGDNIKVRLHEGVLLCVVEESQPN